MCEKISALLTGDIRNTQKANFWLFYADLVVGQISLRVGVIIYSLQLLSDRHENFRHENFHKGRVWLRRARPIVFKDVRNIFWG